MKALPPIDQSANVRAALSAVSQARDELEVATKSHAAAKQRLDAAKVAHAEDAAAWSKAVAPLEDEVARLDHACTRRRALLDDADRGVHHARRVEAGKHMANLGPLDADSIDAELLPELEAIQAIGRALEERQAALWSRSRSIADRVAMARRLAKEHALPLPPNVIDLERDEGLGGTGVTPADRVFARALRLSQRATTEVLRARGVDFERMHGTAVAAWFVPALGSPNFSWDREDAKTRTLIARLASGTGSTAEPPEAAE